MGRKKVNVFYELVRRYRELSPGSIRGSDEEEHEVYVSDEAREEVLGLYCSKDRALVEKEIWEDTELHKAKDEETISLRVRKKKETIEEIELISLDELESLAEAFENENYYS